MITTFLRELKRRRVLRTASYYVVGAWVALQVVEVLADAGLPPGTLRNLLILLSFGFPLVLVIGWFFDVSTEGITKTGPVAESEQLPALEFLDHVLLVGLLVVIGIDAYILSLPPPVEEIQASTPQQRTIAIFDFEDLELANGDDPVGEALSSELRSSLTRIAGLRVLGPDTSKLLQAAGEAAFNVAAELSVTAMLKGDVRLEDDVIQVNAMLIGVPAGNELWSSGFEGPVSDAVSLQDGLLDKIVAAVAPNLDSDPVQGPRAEVGTCGSIYDKYLRGKQLTTDASKSSDRNQRGIRLLREAVAEDEHCAVAWEALAQAEHNPSVGGLTRAGAAARRALELNDALPEAWAVLAEIAEEEGRWSDSEEYFLRALYADPTNVYANVYYGEALQARGRVKEALPYVMAAYRHEPASGNANWHVTITGIALGDGDLVVKHANIMLELGFINSIAWDTLAEGYLAQGDVDAALETWAQMQDVIAPWYPDCVRERRDPAAAPGLIAAMRETKRQRDADTDRQPYEWFWHEWNLTRCSIWLGEADMAYELLLEEGVPTEGLWIVSAIHDAGILRRDPRYHDLVVETGLLDYWKKWGWSDYCEPVGDDFRCE
jgi:TolB-like protein